MSLTASMSVKLGPILFGTLVRHFLDKQVVTKDSKAREELVYDEMFIIVKTFMETSTKHTVEELQAFSNTKIPPPPWVRTVEVRIPLSSCDVAADKLIEALGGPEVARKVAGGTRWWQVRSMHGIHGEWIMVKKDVDEDRKRRKHELRRSRSQARMNGARDPNPTDPMPEPHVYATEMDGTRCMLYIHGGGYYFGSIDQQRYCLHRYARKMNGRVFAINYRLAPQYPFPCAIQDALAAYIYLINPPPGALHTPVDPSLIICAGDSAGGGTVLALLQVIRDAGLPPPAGAILISPWCDLTHSFPSLHTNGATDIIPPYGLSVHKPSLLWPPPSLDVASAQQKTLTKKIKNAFMRRIEALSESQDTELSPTTPKDRQPSSTTILGDKITDEEASPIASKLQNFAVPTDHVRLLVDGKDVEIKSQFQFYAMNNQLCHPLVSPALGYLGGLPPCLFVVSDKEVLRDEIIYTAHKAAHPERYGINNESRQLYPVLNGIEDRYQPTNVHLQVYDETCHVLPLYSFCTPAKYCYRAIATFCKQVANKPTPDVLQESDDVQLLSPQLATSPVNEGEDIILALPARNPASRATSLTRRLSQRLSFNPRNSAIFNFGSESRNNSEDRPTPETKPTGGSDELPDGPDTAGNPAVYETNPLPFKDRMVRERVSTRGILRPLEPEDELAGCKMEHDKIGILNEVSIKRYLKGQNAWQKKYSSITKSIEKARRRNLEIAERKDLKRLQKLRAMLASRKRSPVRKDSANSTADNVSEVSSSENESTNPACVHAKQVLGSRQWDWGWALEGETPPPSSIVSRRDTAEARQLGRIADKQFGPGDSEHYMSGNNLWQVIVELLTDPGSGKSFALAHGKSLHQGHANHSDATDAEEGQRTITSRFFGRNSSTDSRFLTPPTMGTVRPRKQSTSKPPTSSRSSIFFPDFFSRRTNESQHSIAEQPEPTTPPVGPIATDVEPEVFTLQVPVVRLSSVSADHLPAPSEQHSTKRFSLFRSHTAR